MPDSSVNLATPTGNADTVTTPNGDHRQVVILGDRGGYRGRAYTFRIPGAAGTAGQRLASIFNASGSAIHVEVKKITVDVYQTAAKVVAPPVIRVHRIAATPTGGAALAKVAEDTSLSSSASVTLLQGASADGTASALTSAISAGTMVTQEPAARALTLVGYEQFDRTEFLTDSSVLLRAGEGLLVNLDYTVATSNPVTDMWFVGFHWSEFAP